MLLTVRVETNEYFIVKHMKSGSIVENHLLKNKSLSEKVCRYDQDFSGVILLGRVP